MNVKYKGQLLKSQITNYRAIPITIIDTLNWKIAIESWTNKIPIIKSYIQLPIIFIGKFVFVFAPHTYTFFLQLLTLLGIFYPKLSKRKSMKNDRDRGDLQARREFVFVLENLLTRDRHGTPSR